MEAIAAITRTVKTLVDGTLRLTVDIEPVDAVSAFAAFSAPGTPVALAQLNMAPTAAQDGRKIARSLVACGWYYAPKVLGALGDDDEFLAFIRSQPCAITGSPAPSEAAHVRRIANGAGVGVKPPFSAIPLCHDMHIAQHQHGESAIGGKSEVDKLLAEYLIKWGKQQMRGIFNVASTRDINCAQLIDFAKQHDITMFLPRECREYM